MNRIWIYQSSRPFTSAEQAEISEAMDAFVRQWAAHNVKLDARFEIRHSQFIILSVNQEEVMASGCSIDTSFRFMLELDSKYGLSLFDRQNMAYISESGDIQVCHINQIGELYASGLLKDNSTVFNNIIQDEALLSSSWEIPFKQSGFAMFAD